MNCNSTPPPPSLSIIHSLCILLLLRIGTRAQFRLVHIQQLIFPQYGVEWTGLPSYQYVVHSFIKSTETDKEHPRSGDQETHRNGVLQTKKYTYTNKSNETFIYNLVPFCNHVIISKDLILHKEVQPEAAARTTSKLIL